LIASIITFWSATSALLRCDLARAARDVEMEVERYRARSKGGSLITLSCGLFALNALSSAAGARSAEQHDAIKSAFVLVREELGEISEVGGWPADRAALGRNPVAHS
jgi:hypothetical protein